MLPGIANVLRQSRSGFSVAWFTKTSDACVQRLYGSTNPLRPMDVPFTRGDTLTALHRTSALLPKVLHSEKVATWTNLIKTSGEILSKATIHRPRIAVLGLDELAQPDELVSALLDDPLAPNQRIIDVLRCHRRQFPNDPIAISHGRLTRTNIQLNLNSQWMKMDVEIIPAGHPDLITLLYGADIQIMVTSLLATPLARDIQSVFTIPSSFVLLNYPTFNQQVVDYAISRLAHLYPTTHDTLKAKMLQVRPMKALSALDVFRQNPTSPDNIHSFQTDFLRSGVITLSQAVSRVLSSDQETRGVRCAHTVLTGALEACRDAAQVASRDVAAVKKTANELRSWICNAYLISVQDVLGGSDAPEVKDSVQRSTREMRVVMDIPWWKVPLKVDDMGETIYSAVERTWCRDLEAKLRFETGRLAARRLALIAETLEILRLLQSSFHSAVLVNILHQLSVRPPELAPNTLTYPLLYRLQQLQQPILSLHRRAQRAILTVITSAFGTMGGIYAIWLLGWINPPAALGLVALGWVFALRWFVGKWEAGKTRWWEDWHRVGEGLERDIKETLVLVVENRVIEVPSKAVEDLEKVAAMRLQELDGVIEEVNNIENSFRRPYSKQHTSGEQVHGR